MFTCPFHPFTTRQSQRVTDLLITYRRANFEVAGIDPNLATNYITTIREQKNTQSEEKLRLLGDKLLLQAKNAVKYPTQEKDPLDVILSLEDAGTLLDIGANKCTTINYLAPKYPHMHFIGLDVIPQRETLLYPQRCTYKQELPDPKTWDIEPFSCDYINIQFVFHHVDSLETIENIISFCHRTLKPTGKLYLREETFVDGEDQLSPEKLNEHMQVITDINNNMGILTNREFTKAFDFLSGAERREFIIANDRLINVGNPHMQRTGQYYTVQERNRLFEKHGFTSRRGIYLGLRTNGKIKQGVHYITQFKKQN